MANCVRVLLVDDDESVRRTTREILEYEGYQVVTAGDGTAALRLVEVDPPDLIVLDLRMEGMDGKDFLHVYRRRPGPRAPVLLLSAAREMLDAAGTFGADAYLEKPFELDDLLAAVARLCRDAARTG